MIIQVLIIFLCTSFIFGTKINNDVVNSKVTRNVDLSSHLVRVTNQITISNRGSKSLDEYLYFIDPILEKKFSFIGASLPENKNAEKQLKIKEVKVDGHGDKMAFRIDLSPPLATGSDVTIEVETVFGHAQVPFPSSITQSEKQFVKFSGNVYYYSGYASVTQTSTIVCASANIDSYTKEKPVSASEKTITYGAYENVEAFKKVDMVIHSENNTPFLTVTSMLRLIEVSHWGNIAVEETIDMLHTGALLKGSFSRYDYQRQQDGVSSVKSFKTILPVAAKDVYYRDEIGNISTSHMKEMDDGIELELRPRFPLFGGWKTQYTIGYNVPSYQYLYNNGDEYMLKMKFVDHIYDDQLIDEIHIKVILPERANDVRLNTPYDVKRLKDSLHHTYLDTKGRPVIEITKRNLVDSHIQDFELRYKFVKVQLLQEPMLLVVAFLILFATAIISVRLDFSIAKDEASETKLRAASLLKEAGREHEYRSALYQSYEDAINKYKQGKDLNAFKVNQKKIDADHKQISQKISTFQTKLKSELSTDSSAEKVAELQRLDTQVREQIGLAILNAEKLVNGKMTKQQYLDAEAAIKSKKDDLCHKMDSILQTI